MPRKKANVPVEKKEDPGHINEYDIDSDRPFDNKQVLDKIEDLEEFPTEEELAAFSEQDEHNAEVIHNEIDSPIPDLDPPKPQDPEAQPLTEAELENIIGDDNAIIDQEIDQSVIEPEEIGTYGDDPLAVVKDEDEIEEESGTIVQQLEQEKKHALKLKNIAFLQEYAKAVHRTVDEVANKQGISLQTAKNFINEYIKIVRRAIEDKDYPDAVLAHYNRGVSTEKKFKHHQMDALKEIVRKYSQYNVNSALTNKRLNNHGNDNFISNNRVASNSSNPLSQFADSSTSSHSISQDSEIKEVRDGITSLQLIKFGLINAFGQAAKMRISAMIGSDPTPYLTDEQRMKNLLIMAGATEHKAQTFIEWLKTHARYVSQPIGFLNYGLPGYNQNRYGQMGGGGMSPGMMGGGGGQYGDPMGGYDSAMTDYYYQQGIYLPGIPPNHPANREALQKYKQEKAQKDQLEAMTRQSEMFMRMQMIKTMSAMGQGDQQGGRSGSLFTPEMLLVTGMGRYERTGIDEQGKPIYGIVPNLNGAQGGMGGYPGAPGMMPGQPMLGPNGLPINPMDQTSSTLGLVKEIMQTMQMMQQQTNQQNNGEKSFFSEVMGGLAQRVLAPPPQENKLKDFVETFEVISKLNGGGGLMGQPGSAPPPDPMYMLETQRLQNEKEFGLQALRLKEKDMDMKASASQRSEGDATKNMQWFVSTMSETLGPLLTGGMQFLFNRGAIGGGGPGAGMGADGGMAMQPGAGGPGGMNQTALNTIIEMEYAKEERRKKEEAEQKRREWDEEVRRKEEERNREIAYQRSMNQAGGTPQPSVQVFRPQQPAPGVIQQGPSQYENAFTVEQPRNQPMNTGRSIEDQEITVDTFLPHSIDDIQVNIEKALKQKQFLEKYIANAEEAVNEKVALGEPVSTPTDAFGIPLEENQGQSPDNVWDPTVSQEQPGTGQLQTVLSPEEEIPQFIEKQENDINEFLQTFPSEAVDPDYVGPKEEDIDEKGLENEHKEEEIDI